MNKDHDQMTEHELRTEVLKLRAELNRASKKVTKEWIIESAENVAADYPDIAFPNLITIFKGLLTEAGVSITVDPHGKSGR